MLAAADGDEDSPVTGMACKHSFNSSMPCLYTRACQPPRSAVRQPTQRNNHQTHLKQKERAARCVYTHGCTYKATSNHPEQPESPMAECPWWLDAAKWARETHLGVRTHRSSVHNSTVSTLTPVRPVGFTMQQNRLLSAGRAPTLQACTRYTTTANTGGPEQQWYAGCNDQHSTESGPKATNTW